MIETHPDIGLVHLAPTGDFVALVEHRAIAGSDAVRFFAAAWAGTIAEGLDHPREVPFDGYDRALVAHELLEPGAPPGPPVGGLAFRVDEANNRFWICLGWVLPVWRRRGVYRALFDRLAAIARTEGRQAIAGMTRTDNAAMRVVAARLGRAETAVLLEFPVDARTPPPGPGLAGGRP